MKQLIKCPRNAGNPVMEGILAIDPAGPIFEGNKVNKLGKNDAKAVQVFHTNSNGIFPFALGYEGNVGSVDFYFNGAKHQPGCGDLDTSCHHAFGHHFLLDLNNRNAASSGSGYRNMMMIV